jgi:hypothetical protein
MRKLIIICAVVFSASLGFAYSKNGTVYTTNGSQSDVQAAVTNASDGDTINIPSGSFNWGSSYITWTDKNISVIGAGIDVTTITVSGSWAFLVYDNTKASFRISSMTLTGSPGSGYFSIDSSYQTNFAVMYGWRVDHIKMSHGSTKPGYGSVMIAGVNYGVFDNCQLITNYDWGEFFFFELYGYANYHDGKELSFSGLGQIKGGYSWAQPMGFGTQEAIYIEDCTFSAPNMSGAGHPFDGGYGTKVVLRHSTSVGGGPLIHPVSTDHLGTIKYEIYNNSFSGAAYTGWFALQIQSGGSGVVFNNQWINFGAYYNQNLSLRECRASGGCGGNCSSGSPIGTCDGSHSWDGNIEASGWPCFGQVGRSPGTLGAGVGGTPIYGVSDPVYAWRNGAEAACANDSGTCTNVTNLVSDSCPTTYVKSTVHSNGDVDFINNGSTPKPGYAAYTYPHPLRGESTGQVGTGVSIPGGVTIK